MIRTRLDDDDTRTDSVITEPLSAPSCNSSPVIQNDSNLVPERHSGRINWLCTWGLIKQITLPWLDDDDTRTDSVMAYTIDLRDPRDPLDPLLLSYLEGTYLKENTLQQWE